MLQPEIPFYLADSRWPVKDWENRHRSKTLRRKPPAYEAPEFYCDTELAEDSDGSLDPNIPKPDIVFKYREEKDGPLVGLKSIELRVLSPVTKDNENAYYRVLLPRYVIKECGRLYLDHNIYTSSKIVKKRWSDFYPLWVGFHLPVDGAIRDAEAFFQMLEKAVSSNQFMTADTQPMAGPPCSTHNYACRLCHPRTNEGSIWYEPCTGWGPRRVFWMEMFGNFGNLYEIYQTSKKGKSLNHKPILAMKKHIKLLRQLYERGDLSIAAETPVETNDWIDIYPATDLVWHYPEIWGNGPRLHGWGIWEPIGNPHFEHPHHDMEFGALITHPERYGWKNTTNTTNTTDTTKTADTMDTADTKTPKGMKGTLKEKVKHVLHKE
ncbi:hypothetical protein N7528_001418 [Penicillium herquei]|nr:hypothetical protein N7528_001418 [Penicillium herquei]